MHGVAGSGRGALPTLPEPRPAENTVPGSGIASLGISEAKAGPGGRGAGAAGRRCWGVGVGQAKKAWQGTEGSSA